jgi:PII-like signaling protein
MTRVKVVRVYLTEDALTMNEIYGILRQEQIAGATVFRGIKGYGHSGKNHEATLMDMHFDLPLVLEFFGEEEKIDKVLNMLSEKIAPGRILHWLANLT